jgi:hypothetical protein
VPGDLWVEPLVIAHPSILPRRSQDRGLLHLGGIVAFRELEELLGDGALSSTGGYLWCSYPPTSGECVGAAAGIVA